MPLVDRAFFYTVVPPAGALPYRVVHTGGTYRTYVLQGGMDRKWTMAFFRGQENIFTFFFRKCSLGREYFKNFRSTDNLF